MSSDKEAEELLRQLKQLAEDFALSRLAPYTATLKAGGPISASSKEVNDAIWGTIRLLPLEVVVLDSPLVQRLRYVRQLGVVHWVYPGATHARFEHTLGVLYQAQQLISAINQAAGTSPSAPPIDTHKGGLVRLCAILHDIGHAVFSHVSEHVLQKNQGVKDALKCFARQHKLEKVQLSELMAFNFVGSPAFKDLLETALDGLGQPIILAKGLKANAKEIIKNVQAAIIGQLIDEQVPLLHEIISGPFDADKLDYYTRDARLAGVPTTLDISRLTQKITVESVATSELPGTIGARVSTKFKSHYVFGLKWSGAAVLDELHLARVLLYTKIYRHKKVMAIEAMVEALLEALAAIDGVSTQHLVKLCYEYADDQLLWSGAEDVLSCLGVADANEQVIHFITDTLRRMRERVLYVGALSVRARYPSDPWEDHEEQKQGLADLADDLDHPSRAPALRNLIVSEVEKIVALDPNAAGGLSAEFIRRSIVISSKPPLTGGTEIDRAFVFQAGKPISYGAVSGVNRPAWADAYDFSAASATIFCPREIAAATYLGAERVFRERYKVIMPRSALEMSKQNTEQVEQLKGTLEKTGYYQGAPLDIRPLPDRLTKGDVSARIDRAVLKIEVFDDPPQQIGARRPPGLGGRIGHWLAQFRNDDDIECAMAVLERLRILGRDDTRKTLTSFLEKHSNFRGATITPLGGLKDSGAMQAYLSRDLGEAFPQTTSVEEAAKRKIDAPLIFLDDFIASGGQASDILGTWFEDPSLQKPSLKEERLPFSGLEQEYLKSRDIAFVFVAGWDEGLAEVAKAAKKCGLKAVTHVEIDERQIPFAFEGDEFSAFDPEVLARFVERCRAIGRQLAGGDGRAEKAEERALGYGNRAMLLASRYNIPTQALTCLWKPGIVDGVDWYPLLSRRPKT